MTKKILILSASPRKNGNSAMLCEQFALGAQETGHSCETIHIPSQKIRYCTGCGTCFLGEKSCPQKDDMPVILEKMIQADVIVMATPVYFYTMNGQMKTLIDRCCARYREIQNKEFYFIATAAENTRAAIERVFLEFRGFTDCLENPQEKGLVYGMGAWEKGDIVNTPAYAEAFALGKSV